MGGKMNLEEIITDPELKEFIDPDTIPDPEEDPLAYEFFEYTIEQLKSDENKKMIEKESGYVELARMELIGMAVAPTTFAVHESLHALAGYLVGASVYGFGYDS